MIRLTEEDIAEFQALHLRETGRQLTREQAAEYAERMLRVVALAAGINPFPPPAA